MAAAWGGAPGRSRRGMARVDRKRFAMKLREIQRRRRWAAAVLFGLLSCGEYCTALAAVPGIRRVLAAGVSLSHTPGLCQN